MSIVKRAFSFGGYGQSKPVISYHTQNGDSVTTVVTEISHMNLNEKQAGYNGAVQKTASLTELCSEDAEVQKHGYGQQAYGSDVGGFDALVRDNAVQKHGYGEQKASSYQHESGAGGYSAHHHESSVQKHGGYGGQKASSYQHGGYDAVNRDGVTRYDAFGQKKHGGYVAGYDALVQKKKHGYGGQMAHGSAAAALHHDSYSAFHHGGATQKKHGYGGQMAYQHGAHAGGYSQGFESDEESEEESDCEEEVLGHAAPGGTQYYAAYEPHQQLGGGSRYKAYQSSTTQGYSGGGGWAQPKNHSYY